MKTRFVTLILFAILAIRADAILYQGFRVFGAKIPYPGDAGIEVTDGVTAIAGYWHDSDDEGHDEDMEEYDEDGSGPFYRRIRVIDRSWTDYQVDLPDEWNGRGLSVSKDGIHWSPFYPMPAVDERIDVNLADLTRTPPPPSQYVTSAGNRIRVGRWWNDAERDVFSITSWDTDNPFWPLVGMDTRASASNAYWRWQHATDDGLGTQTAMDLDYLHRLTIRGRNSGNTISFDPNSGAILVNGNLVLTTENATSQLGGQNGGQFVVRSEAGLNFGSNTLLRPAHGEQSSQIVLGTYNDNRIDPSSNKSRLAGVLIVGSGDNTGNEPRKNGLRILDDGTVLIRPKGDLSMGVFAAGTRP